MSGNAVGHIHVIHGRLSSKKYVDTYPQLKLLLSIRDHFPDNVPVKPAGFGSLSLTIHGQAKSGPRVLG